MKIFRKPQQKYGKRIDSPIQIDSPYFSVENFIAISEQLNKDNLSILHLNIRSLNANIDNFREFLGSLNGNFSVIFLTESRSDETANENSPLSLDNCYSVHQTRDNKKGGIYTQTVRI